jgi:hypothetical protein
MTKYYKAINDYTLCLNTNYNCTKTVNGSSKNTDFSWAIPEVEIEYLGYLQVVNIVAVGASTSSPYFLRLKGGVEYNSTFNFLSDYGFNILSAFTVANGVSVGGTSGDYGITLRPQTIRNITISVSDSLSSNTSGVATTVEFMVVLKIAEVDAKVSQVGDPYREGRSQMNLKL